MSKKYQPALVQQSVRSNGPQEENSIERFENQLYRRKLYESKKNHRLRK